MDIFKVLKIHFVDTKTGERKRRWAICTYISPDGKTLYVIPISTKEELFDINEDFPMSKAYGEEYGATGCKGGVHAFGPEAMINRADVISIDGELQGDLLKDFKEWYG